MANEHTLAWETELPVPYNCTDNIGIEEGALVKLSGAMTIALSSGADDIVGGVMASEKIASSGKKASVYRGGRFKATLSGASVIAGDALATQAGGLNHVKRANLALSGCRILGYALESASAGQTLFYELRPSQSPAL